ncbi:four-carbon acid sugar kinase family protein [Glaesserella parasuis]|uniref:3-oxo-tetronate kinase n=1 Tax=Glaesserella parasuis serovar 5 (strain SH0165) TaxID=557723 RepID=B8F7R0_GLAP5|nr:3-oxo-tetronate kinase [Glaesserella parasuis]ACL33362.1 type III effector Hrp-dependent outer, secretion system component [Glaesserella parasuis SH0165]MDG6282910.1 four-carbon acid sugar kinase family protein [Glaesserella parasuis]MDG6325596.1 four-carbon acid sugar kinase family protein [Glaesserella parasuis]MDG6868972.1 four-carbon acid sugar kinase family protein [Glaesserella parasuis]MDO9649556.1 four-carbon acid sugar kinase family protein [Glaesserella parasuis]
MLGVIADDFTGASDIASFLVENGLKTIQMNGVPTSNLVEPVDAVVISLKSRSNPVNEAIEQSLDALKWLQNNGGKQFYFKYCSTFDSTEKGNIGPVTDALLDELGEDFTIICPALPINGRTIFNGYLFVGNVLLNESGMQNHPITPMKDANLVRLMDMQARGKTGLVSCAELFKGADYVKQRFIELKQQGYRYAVVDSVDNAQLAVLAESIESFKLVTGGSGLAAYMAERISGGKKGTDAFTPTKAKTVILSGSCSVMTNKQVEYYQKHASSYFLEAEQAINNPEYVEQLYQWVISHLNQPLAPMVYATVPPETLKTIQAQFGAEKASHAIETTFARLAEKLKDTGITNFITAGGETSSIVVQQLGFSGFHIGKQIAPGVPWLKAVEEPIYLALKSGNFGKEDFFKFAQEMFV